MKPPPPKHSQKFEVLVVEDDMGRAYSLLSSLQELNMDCRHATNGSQALSAFRDKMPHLVMSDVQMPGMDGFELCRQLRGQSTVPIILMNELITDEHQMKGLKLGADDYVDKNMNEKVMAAHVIAWLRRVYYYDVCDECAPASIQNAPEISSSPQRQNETAPLTRTPAGAPAGWLKCENCNYMGPQQKFVQEGMLDAGGQTCPVCHRKDRLIHSMTLG